MKIISFIVIFSGFQTIYSIIKRIKQKNTDTIKHSAYFCFYFLLNIFLIYLTKPFAISMHEYFRMMNCWYFSNDIGWWYHIIINIFSVISNSIFPFIYGTPVMCAILYSLVFVFFIDTIQKYISKKYWLSVVLLFCLPHTLLWNLVQYRQIYSAYILLFILTFLMRFQYKNLTNIMWSVSFGFICAILTDIRNENIILLFEIPIIVFLLRIFSKKAFITFCITFFTTAVLICSLQKIKGPDEHYVMHNLSFTYVYYVDNNIPMDEYSKYDKDFNIVFPMRNKYNGEDENRKYLIDNFYLGNKESTQIVKYCLIKMTLKQAYRIILFHLQSMIRFLGNNDFLIFYKENLLYKSSKIESIKDYPEKYKILSAIIACNNDDNINKPIIQKGYNFIAKNIFYNVYLHLILLLLIGIYGIITRQKYYVLSFLILFSILIPALIFMPFGCYFYIYPVVFCIWALIYIIFIKIISNVKN